MRVLIACEESQRVCAEFRKLSHEAYSADIDDCSDEFPEYRKYHIRGDVRKILNDGWDMMIAFPPCTHLAVSGARHFKRKIEDGSQEEAVNFFIELYNADIPKIAIENPVGIMSTRLRKPDQIIHPYFFGDPYSKRTCLWLKGLKPLVHIKTRDFFNGATHVDKGEFVTFKSTLKTDK